LELSWFAGFFDHRYRDHDYDIDQAKFFTAARALP
jgi:hypothetical protein